MSFKGIGIKTDNNPQAFRAKVAIRQNVLRALGADAAVFDAFAGAGEMYSAVWKDAASYTGCDQKPQRDGRLMFCADNRRVMRAIDLAKFGIVDLDAWGSPWETALILADRRKVQPEQKFGLVLTCGEGFALKANVAPHALTQLTGLQRTAVGMSKQHDWLLDKAISGIARRMRATVLNRWQARGRTGAAMIYIGLVLSGSPLVARSDAS